MKQVDSIFFYLDYAPKGQKHIAQGGALGKNGNNESRPVRTEEWLKTKQLQSFALTGRVLKLIRHTQGAASLALGYVVLRFQRDNNLKM